ncbi:CaiB/BaiF CoA transferase family protein [Undibacterium oligocarboniphilum]|uniref:CoA transferase n=1 Tax=Undibacterium oligocarboniphilum TaxID=666702 RepID=A0A850QJC3_9BURK|nr:CaiB/BaiF CoA-transferase family protein [Undibacterium oligocarboniphilum]MBC3868880.1 CoA transferase [Undibacterium oligocarboniphilum]NVO76860.1 CoA transferase [Undibacterium oligocarboniphilum]
MSGPLSGIRIIEMVGLGPCPFAGMMLADMGAEVIRIDRPVRPGENNPFPMLGTACDVMARGRRSLALDLKQPESVQVLLELVTKADALIEGFRPGVMERLSLGPDVCQQHNPRLVYGRITGWGQNGPLAQAAGHDLNYIALSGMLHAMGRPDGPPPPPLNLVGDFGGGAMMLAFGVVCALLEARQSGKGQVIDAAMVDGTALLGAMLYGFRAYGAWNDQRGANLLDGGAHFYDTYTCADGKFISVGAIEPQFYALLLKSAGVSDPAFQQQMSVAAWPELKQKLGAIFASRSRAEWCSIMEGTDICFAPVLDMGEAPSHPHNQQRQNFTEVAGVVQPAPAPRFSRTPAQISRPPARPGEQSAEILHDWGIPAALAAAVLR